MKKLEKIKEAYGEYWETVKDFVDENGWVKDDKKGLRYKLLWEIFEGKMDLEKVSFSPKVRLKSLAGIENNNGWIKIESENWLKEKKISVSITKFYVDNPDEDYLSIAVIVSNEEEDEMMLLNDYLFVKKELESSGIFATHYQPIIKTQPPIY